MKGIMFKPEMYLAIRSGAKTQTRRLHNLKEINKEPYMWRVLNLKNQAHFWGMVPEDFTVVKPRYRVGEVVFVQEAWATERHLDNLLPSQIGEAASVPLWYRLDDIDRSLLIRGRWRSPLFMPEWAARTFIKLISVRPERLQEITPEDCLREGLTLNYQPASLLPQKFQGLWDSINPKYPFAGNFWVWVYSVMRLA